jgi:hypothetical protein
MDDGRLRKVYLVQLVASLSLRIHCALSTLLDGQRKRAWKTGRSHEARPCAWLSIITDDCTEFRLSVSSQPFSGQVVHELVYPKQISRSDR